MQADVVIVGGAAIGASTAFALTRAGVRNVIVVERDTTYANSSTARSAASIRHQFSHPLNVAISQYGTEVLRHFAEHTGVAGADVSFRENGYLFLAASAAQEAGLRASHAMQSRLGADIALLSPSDVGARFGHLNTADLRCATLGERGEGWFSSSALMDGFRKGAEAGGARWYRGEAVALTLTSGRVCAVHLADGTEIGCGVLVNAAGPRAAAVAAMAGLDLPVEPRKRTNVLFICAAPPPQPERLPLLIDSTGVFVRWEGRGFLAGGTPLLDPPVAYDDLDPRSDEFDTVVWPALAARSPAFEAIRLAAAWAGHYAYNTLDQNAVIGPAEAVPNFLFANGFSGHGLQQSPAVGRALAEWITAGRYLTLDMTPLGPERILRREPLTEHAII